MLSVNLSAAQNSLCRETYKLYCLFCSKPDGASDQEETNVDVSIPSISSELQKPVEDSNFESKDAIKPTKNKDPPADDTNPKKISKFDTGSITSIHYESDEPDLLKPVLANAADKKLIDRLLGCAYGQALGDAYGLSTEFEERDDVNRTYPDPSKIIPFPDYVLTGHNRRWARGDWTDDTDQWILILVTLMFHDGDEKVFAKKLKDWISYGYPELGDHGGMGLGANVSQVIIYIWI